MNYISLTHTSFDFLIFHVVIHCCYNDGRSSLRRDHISVTIATMLEAVGCLVLNDTNKENLASNTHYNYGADHLMCELLTVGIL